MQRFGIIAPNHARPKILNLFLAGIERLRNDLGYFPCVVVSGEEDKQMCSTFNITHITQENHPVSFKFSTACYALKGEVDFLITSGSDDLFSTATVKSLLQAMEQGWDIVGVDTLYFYATDGAFKGKLVKLYRENRILGVGKCISSRVLDKVDWKPWRVAKNWGLDAMADNCLRPHVRSKYVVKDAVIVDFKSKVNINHAGFVFAKYPAANGEELSFLSDKEKQILRSL